ncbi:snf2 family dna-dependent atpase [Moniliophthora roreri MCA 2997]|uniref:Snf2 family dna-dependent atpase n=1 Tax=Moniliophthora roreri (strain MCA 2997) TaxID=1381753 RepID=V2X0M2_MONRO|nr:snf2 family dna-dependent atpase [Moniliophthora roreri MCA 2997]
MAATPAGGSSRLLDALDNSVLTQRISKELPPRTLLHAPSGNTGESSVTPELLQEARLEQERQRLTLGPDANGDLSLLLSSSAGTSKKRVAGGFRLNYDDESQIRSFDVGGADQAQRMAEFVTKGINNASHGLTVKGSMKKLGLRDEDDILPGLDVRLLRHQMIGVAWMLDKELKSKDKGGILADDMGLGKTVQMIATMIVNQPKNEDDACKTTLIIVPAALLQQWKDEIEEKTNGIMNVHVHHGKDKLKKTSDVKSKDVVITTYQTLVLDFNLSNDVEDGREAAWLAQNGGVLARTKFFRVVADEAQFIRNRATRTSQSVALVRAKYRWMLTGTPVTNSLADIYGLLRFGRFRPFNDWNEFNNYVARVQAEDTLMAGQRAQAILSPILLRRTKDSELEGEPLLKLPPKDIEVVMLQFSEDERDIYENFEKTSKTRINKFIKEGTLLKNHHYILVLILRLRQMCCHPNLILAQAEDLDDPTMLLAGDAEKERARAVKAKGRDWVEAIKKRFLLRARSRHMLSFSDESETSEATCPRCEDMLLKENGRVLDCGHEICFDCTLDLKNSPIDHDGIFGEGTEKENIEAERRFEDASAKGHRPCPTCKRMLDMSATKIFKSMAFEPTEEELTKQAEAKRKAKAHRPKKEFESEVEIVKSNFKSFQDRLDESSDDDLPDPSTILGPPAAKRRKSNQSQTSDDDDILDLTMDDISSPLKPPKKGKRKVTGRQVEDSDIDSDQDDGPSSKKLSKARKSRFGAQFSAEREALLQTWAKGDDDLQPSTKMLKLVDYISEWEAIGDKTICYSQWTSMLDLIEKLFSRYGIRSVRFDGRMDRTSREQALSTFKSPTGPKVILISTKCGGVGLNLVAANRVINMDVSWNFAAESQAYDRAHRIGQEKNVYIKRLVVENTIEERMLQLQEVKVGLAEAALGEGTGTKLHKLSMKDIKFLFAMNNVAPNQAKAQAEAQEQTTPKGARGRSSANSRPPTDDSDDD